MEELHYIKCYLIGIWGCRCFIVKLHITENVATANTIEMNCDFANGALNSNKQNGF